MRAPALGALLVCLLVFAFPADAQEAPGGDRSSASIATALIGEQFTMRLETVADAGIEIELDPAAPGWQGMQVVRIESRETQPEGDQVRHIFTVTVAGFFPGDITVVPTLVEVAGGLGLARELPPVQVLVTSTLPADAPLELRPLAGPQAIAGAESPWLRPGIAAGGVLTLALLAGIVTVVIRAIRRRRPVRLAEEPLEPVPSGDLGGAERLLDADPVGAYRALATAVRQVIALRYDLPATALTTRELRRRMEEAAEVDRWQARLVGGLLEECDAVIYAGYRPAAERRRADLDMAREIIEAAT